MTEPNEPSDAQNQKPLNKSNHDHTATKQRQHLTQNNSRKYKNGQERDRERAKLVDTAQTQS